MNNFMRKYLPSLVNYYILIHRTHHVDYLRSKINNFFNFILSYFNYSSYIFILSPYIFYLFIFDVILVYRWFNFAYLKNCLLYALLFRVYILRCIITCLLYNFLDG